ncbi:MAG: menaquinone biosynthesis decarboxylase [Campylobacterales bacterium]|nr:menaquinone biosynthesis decarboxylase [Campylobacterales bacterium]
MKKFLEELKRKDDIVIIDQEVDINLEIGHIAYCEVKKENGGKALLFTNPVDKKNGKKFDIPVLMNLYGSSDRTNSIFGREINEISDEIEGLLKLSPPTTFGEKLGMAGKLFNLKNVFPKRTNSKGICQEIVKTGDDVKLSDLPILTTWEEDGGPFITMGQVITRSLDGKINNVGMYRLQVYNDNQLGLHWQIHKDSTSIFDEFKEAGKKMPIAVAIGGDPLYTWCGTAPLPKGIFELMMYGFIKNEPLKMVKCVTNDLHVPHDVDMVIEGFADPEKLIDEGPFGDHTGYYTPVEPYPVMDVTAITMRKEPIYLATVVGKPPIEDKYLGYPTERIFLPLLKTTVPDLIDYRMPENGVFHNLIIAKIQTRYPGHAQQTMHALWGVGQMSFVKHAIFVDQDAPELEDDEALTKHILDRVDLDSLLVSSGVIDALDHSSPKGLVGGKLGVDATGEKKESDIELLSTSDLLMKLSDLEPNVLEAHQIMTDTVNPITFIKVKKKFNVGELFKKMKPLEKHLKLVFVVDDMRNQLDNFYMLLWRVTNNIDARRDLFTDGFIGLDATTKDKEYDNYHKEWPKDTDCTPSVLEDLKNRDLLDIDDEFIKRWHI